MIIIIYNKSIKNLGNKIAQKKDAVPAGGTTSAINGYLAVSLLELVFNVSKNNFNENNIEEIETPLQIVITSSEIITLNAKFENNVKKQ